MAFQLILPASGQANQKCVKIVRKWKARTLYRALQYPISDFSGEEKIQIGNWYNPKTYKKKERQVQEEKQVERNRKKRTTDKKKRILPTLIDLITNLSHYKFTPLILHIRVQYITICYMSEAKWKTLGIKVLQAYKINYLYYL